MQGCRQPDPRERVGGSVARLSRRRAEGPYKINSEQGCTMKKTLLTLLATAAMSASALAADIKPAIIYDLGGKFDKSFNEAAYNGAERFKKETGIEYRDFEIANDAQREQALRRFAGDGNNPIVMAGFSWSAALEKVAAEYPDTSSGSVRARGVISEAH